jgi:hypothetical protein
MQIVSCQIKGKMNEIQSSPLPIRLINMARKAHRLQNEVAALQVELDGADSIIENLKK